MITCARIPHRIHFFQRKFNHRFLCTHTNTKTYSEPCQISKMERFANIVNGWKPILCVWQGSEYVSATFIRIPFLLWITYTFIQSKFTLARFMLNCIVSFMPDIKLNTFMFVFFTFLGVQIRAYGSSIVLQLPLHLLTLIVNG